MRIKFKKPPALFYMGITEGKEYEVFYNFGNSVQIMDDHGDYLVTRLNHSEQLGGGDWTVLEEEDA